MKNTTLNKVLWTGVLAAGMAALGGCTTMRSHEMAAANTESDGSGSRLWAQNCIRCHNMRPPTTYSDAQWEVIMMHMRIRANLTPTEHKQILEFLKGSG
jgi:hypothetical protein